MKKELSNLAVLGCICIDDYRVSENFLNMLSSELSERQVLTHRKRSIISADFLHKFLAVILAMISFATGTATVATHSKKLFSERSRQLDLLSKAGGEKSTSNKIST